MNEQRHPPGISSYKIMQVNDEYIFTIRNPANIQDKVAIGVSYEAFVDDVQVRLFTVWLCQYIKFNTPSGSQP